MTALLGVVGVVLSALITGAVAWAVARSNATATPYDSLANRVSTLEAKDQEKSQIITRLRDHLEVVIRDRDALVSYIKQLSAWVSSGAKPPAPTVPTHLHDLLDPLVFDVAHITEITTTTTTQRIVDATPEE